MKFNPDRHYRRSIRLSGYDYSNSGAYFLTVCSKYRECLFGEIQGEEISLTTAGEIVQKTWLELPNRFTSVELDAFIVMPNHIHGIMVFDDDKKGVGLLNQGAASGAPTVGNFMRAFKSISAVHINKELGREGLSLWQRNFYERIIRNEKELNSIRHYIDNNPAKWADDENNPNKL